MILRRHGYVEEEFKVAPAHVSMLIGVGSELPPSASVASALVAPKNQIGTDSCLGMAGAQAFRTACLARGIECPDLSGLFLYKLGRASMGTEDSDVGMSFPAMLEALTRFGIASEEAWPFAIDRVNTRPNVSAFRDANDRRGLRGYYTIDRSDVMTVRRAIAAKVPVIGAWALGKSFVPDLGPDLIDVPADGEEIVGLHAMLIERYEADGSFGLLNHYGVEWRSEGRCHFTERYVAQSLGFIAMDVGGHL